tara:strand:+ start:728 stop:997 length:270 start_codon:yes stop_codon:yes gene_type:complete
MFEIIDTPKKQFDYHSTHAYKEKMRKRLSKIWVDCDRPNCESCGGRYNLAYPCIWHLSDSYEHQQRRKEFMKKRKTVKSDTDTKQQALY